MKPVFARVFAFVLAAFIASADAHQVVDVDGTNDRPLRLAVVGLVHGHVEGLLWNARERDDIEIVGIWEPNAELFDQMAERYGLAPHLRFTDLAVMLDETEPEAASVMTSTAGHRAAVEACAPRGVHTLVEKPLATTLADADAMLDLARDHGVHVLTNYETSWYPSVHETHRLTRDRAHFTPIRRAVFRHGHPGPVEIGCSPEFLEWLTDPVENGAGALFDFGCYGAAIMTWLADGRPPDTVSATVRTLKPDLYPRVDDDATITLGYPDRIGVVQASWAWTHDLKEMDIFTETGSLHAGKWTQMTIRDPDAEPRTVAPPPRPQPYDNEWSYLRAVARGECDVDLLSSIELNREVVRILDAARRSAVTGRAIRLSEFGARP
ncbi:MAG: Gfo/Idh/MocA family oxidoreductase [Planctomycetota bacterium]